MDSSLPIAYNGHTSEDAMKRRAVLASALTPFVFLLVASVAYPLGLGSDHPKAKIIATIFPLKEFAAAVAGEKGQVEQLIPPGAGVHTWQPRPSDLVKIVSSDLFIYIGANLEPWIKDILKEAAGKKTRIIEVAGLMDFKEFEGEREERDRHGHGLLDPHVWLDFEAAQKICDILADSFSSIDPAGEPYFRANAASYKARLQKLDSDYKAAFQRCAGKTFVLAGHAAFGYLAKRYGLEQVSLYGLSPDAQPSPKRLIEVTELARRLDIKVVFFESSASPDLARTLAHELGARTLVLYPGHNLTRREILEGTTFIDIMKENLRSLKDGLGCR